jgi:hypothetical protein
VSSERLDGKEYSENSFFFARSFFPCFSQYIMTWFRHTQWEGSKKCARCENNFLFRGLNMIWAQKSLSGGENKSTEATDNKFTIMLCGSRYAKGGKGW